MGEPVIRREPSLNAVSADSRLQALLLWHEIETFNARYAAALDEQRLSDWTEMFTDDALYVILSRENFDRGLPVGLIYCENKGMNRDRAFALVETSMFDACMLSFTPWKLKRPLKSLPPDFTMNWMFGPGNETSAVLP